MKISNIYIRNVKSVTEFTDNLTDPVGDEPLSSRVINGSHNIGCTTILDCVEELLMSLRSTRIEFREIGEAEMMAQESWCGITVCFTDAEIEEQKRIWEELRPFREYHWERTEHTPSFPTKISIYHVDGEYYCSIGASDSSIMCNRWIHYGIPPFPNEVWGKVRGIVEPLRWNVEKVDMIGFANTSSDHAIQARWYFNPPNKNNDQRVELVDTFNSMLGKVLRGYSVAPKSRRLEVNLPNGNTVDFSELSITERMLIHLINILLLHQGPNTIFLIDNFDVGLRAKHAQAMWQALVHIKCGQKIVTSVTDNFSCALPKYQVVYL